MPMRINNNISAINAQRSVGRNLKAVNRGMSRLSSGLRVNRAADDASGLMISEGLRSEVARLSQNVRNAQQGSDLLQVAEGSLQQVNDILGRMKGLAIESANATVSDTGREAISAEFSNLVAEIDRIAQATSYNSQNLLSGFGNQVSAASTALTSSATTGVARIELSATEADTFTFIDSAGDNQLTLGNGVITQTLSTGTILDGSTVATGATAIANFDHLGIQVTLTGPNTSAGSSYVDGDLNEATIIVEGFNGGVFQVGPSARAVDRIEVGIPDLRATGESLNLNQASVGSIGDAREAITSIDDAISTVASSRGSLGSTQNRLSFSISFTEAEIESIQTAEATIRDADVALEVSELSRHQVLLQSGNAMLVQANIGSLQVLSLL